MDKHTTPPLSLPPLSNRKLRYALSSRNLLAIATVSHPTIVIDPRALFAHQMATDTSICKLKGFRLALGEKVLAAVKELLVGQGR